MPSHSDGIIDRRWLAPSPVACDSREPIATSGRVRVSANWGNSSVTPNTANSTIATLRACSLA